MSAENKKISLIIPIYNVEAYLVRCIESIINQTYKNMEIILVDDGSPDHCGKICDKYGEKDPRIRVIHKPNGGLSDARNSGLQIATGEILGFVDSDDWLPLDSIETSVKLMEEHEADIVAFGSYKSDGKSKETRYTSSAVETYTREEALMALSRNDKIESHVWDKIYKREIWNEIRFPVGKLFEDVYVMHRVFVNADKVVFVDKPLYYYYQRDNSIVSHQTIQSRFDIIEGYESRLVYLADESEHIRRLTKENIVWSVISTLRMIAEFGKGDCSNEVFKLRAILKKYPVDHFEIGVMSRGLKCDYLILMHCPKIYNQYRKMIYMVKNTKMRTRSVIKICYHSLRRLWRCMKEKIEPVGIDCLKDADQKHRVLLMGGPEYNNLGDHAIAYATKEFVQTRIKDACYIEISEREIMRHLSKLKKYIRESDVLLLQGGGNLGDVYKDQQRIRELVIKAFPNNRIIMIPQTVYFNDTRENAPNLVKIKELFESHQHLFLFAREEYSFALMQKLFCKCKVALVPDIVLSLSLEKMQQKNEREGVCVCFRSDRESILELADKDFVLSVLNRKFSKVDPIDTVVNNWVRKEAREKELMSIWRKIASCELLVTDRLHGMIFAAITKTPCIAFSNDNKKIMGVYKWISNCKWIEFCENPYDIPKKIEEVLRQEKECFNLEKAFNPLKDALEDSIR